MESLPVTTRSPPASHGLVGAADFNGDGLLDLVFGRGGGAPVEARFGQSTLRQ